MPPPTAPSEARSTPRLRLVEQRAAVEREEHLVGGDHLLAALDRGGE